MIKFATPSLKGGKGVAAAPPPPAPPQAASAASRAPAAAPFSSVAARVGFRRAASPAGPEFDFMAPLADASEAEVSRRRTLMRRAAAHAYGQMGYSAKAHEACRASLLWLNRLVNSLDDSERPIGERLARRLGEIVEELRGLAEAKVERTARLERVLVAAKRKLGTAKRRKKAVLQDDVQGMQRPKRKKTLWPEEAHPETAEPEVDLTEVLLGAGDEIREKEAQKKSQQSGKKAVRGGGEKGTSRPSVEG